jgi:nitrogen regulatory protein PII
MSPAGGRGARPSTEAVVKEVTIVIRKDRVDPVVHALAAVDLPRFHVSHVHAVGAGIDPDEARFSMEEGTRYTEKAKIEVFCRQEDVETVVGLVREHAATGQRGDGLITVTPLERIVSVRTGDEELLAVV